MKNLILFLADDLGWRDLQCFGSSYYETPHLDQLARRSLIFDNAYASSPVCSPSRGSILTGRYPARLGLTDWIDNENAVHPASGALTDAPYIKGLPPDQPNLASILHERDYQTWHVGKWHLGGGASLPENIGFDVNIGGCEVGSPGAGGYFSPWSIPALKNAPVPEGTSLTDFLTDEALRLIRRRDPRRPFFLNMWYYLVHTPIQAREALVEKYSRKADIQQLSTLNPFVDGEHFPCEHKREERIRRRVLQSDPVYAAMIESLDSSIGRIIEVMKEEGLYDESILLFTSDNGGLSTAEGSPTCNLPLAEGKGWSYEGGMRVPLIIRGPEIERNTPGTLVAEPVSGIDILPSVCRLLNIPLPENHPVDGIPVPGDASRASSERPIFWHYPHYGNQGGTPAAALRSGEWKLIYFYESDHCELYRLTDDIGEVRNLAHRHPRTRDELKTLLFQWQKSLEAHPPRPRPDFVPWPNRGSGSRRPASPKPR